MQKIPKRNWNKIPKATGRHCILLGCFENNKPNETPTAIPVTIKIKMIMKVSLDKPLVD
jgi:hypothetical protein